MNEDALTQSELDEIIGKLGRALARGEIEQQHSSIHDEWRKANSLIVSVADTAWRYRIRRKPIAGWVNVYPDNMPPYASRELADVNAMPLRIACVYVEETEAPGDDESS